MADVIEQDTLVEIKGRRPTKLPEVFVRPALDGKRLPGEVEIHQNGLRYQSPMGSQKIGAFFILRYPHGTNLCASLYQRYIVQQRQTSILPAMRPRVAGHYPRSPQGTYHDREEESSCGAIPVFLRYGRDFIGLRRTFNSIARRLTYSLTRRETASASTGTATRMSSNLSNRSASADSFITRNSSYSPRRLQRLRRPQ